MLHGDTLSAKYSYVNFLADPQIFKGKEILLLCLPLEVDLNLLLDQRSRFAYVFISAIARDKIFGEDTNIRQNEYYWNICFTLHAQFQNIPGPDRIFYSCLQKYLKLCSVIYYYLTQHGMIIIIITVIPALSSSTAILMICEQQCLTPGKSTTDVVYI